MINLKAELVDFDKISKNNREWYKRECGIFGFFPQENCGRATEILFDLFESSSLIDSDNSFDKHGIKLIKELGLECQIYFDSKEFGELNDYLINLEVNGSHFFTEKNGIFIFNRSKE